MIHNVQQALVDLELCNVFLTFEYVDELVKCGHSIEKQILAWAKLGVAVHVLEIIKRQ